MIACLSVCVCVSVCVCLSSTASCHSLVCSPLQRLWLHAVNVKRCLSVISLSSLSPYQRTRCTLLSFLKVYNNHLWSSHCRHWSREHLPIVMPCCLTITRNVVKIVGKWLILRHFTPINFPFFPNRLQTNPFRHRAYIWWYVCVHGRSQR